MLIDTSGILCLADRREQHHLSAVQHFVSAHRSYTHNYILAEWYPLAQSRELPFQERMTFVDSLLTDARIRVIWVDEALHSEGLAQLQKRPDKEYSLCDAISFMLMRRFRLHEALTADHHFEQEGFIRLLKD